ncbi:asparaginase [Paenibacillus roseipurpureus]|uniref:Asparaginase n=1 Tax=Paenibacillus roseopurpureus TaxID=2918901 RepID=A0AA96RM55_9BACL|nr:asparaginase [Paenibacillus sp. MBLB1832]WNR46116.1 asparaginase [Paenibacillus sp. MBLB1832]
MGERLVVVKRGDQIESEHTGHIAVVDASGELIASLGDPRRITFARSTLKPLQAIPLVQSGASERFLMSAKDIAICCGSHNGEERHVETVLSLLSRIGLDEHRLCCGAHAPYDGASYEALLAQGKKPTVLHNNCSGKHAGMLALALHLHSDIEGYGELQHPVQQRVFHTLCELAELLPEEIQIGTDGCNLPTFGVPLHKLARVFQLFANPNGIESHSLKLAVRQIAASMMEQPEMVGGSDVLCTDLMNALPHRIIAKGGAEGVYCMGLVDKGIGIALKIDDGNYRAAYPAAIETLTQLGLIDQREKQLLHGYHYPPVTNRSGHIVGGIEPVFSLHFEKGAK